MKLEIIVASTRPGRGGLAIGQWFERHARAHGGFEVGFADLAEIDLPMFDEPAHPRLQTYEHDHTKAWSERIAAADAFVAITPEYNYSIAPSLLNAFDYLYLEWNYKPFGFVSYGGVSGGLRAVQMAKLPVTALKMMPMVEAVSLASYRRFIDATGEFVPDEETTKAADILLNETLRWAAALKTMR